MQSHPHPHATGFNIKNPIFIIGVLFFVIGFITWLGSVLIPYLKIACQLNNTQAYLVAFAFYISYMVMAIPAAAVLKKTGFKNGMALGLFIMAVGSVLFIPAAINRAYSLFLTGLFVQGTGLALVQTAANPYVTILGARESAAKRMSIMGVCNGIAASISPLVLGAIILNNTDNITQQLASMNDAGKNVLLNQLAAKVITPYFVMTAVLLILSLAVKYAQLPEIDEEENELPDTVTQEKSIAGFPHLLLGVITLFFYVGVEVISGDTIITYGNFQGIPLSTARFFSSLTQLNMLLGYFVGIVCIPKYISQQKALRLSALTAIAFALTAIFSHGYLSIACIALLGLSNALIWPSVWPLAIAGLGRFTKLGSSLLIMAIGGGAIMPLLYGRLADEVNMQKAYWLVIPCYLFIFYYAVRGHKIKQPGNTV